MKLECKKDNLTKGISLVSHISNSRGSLPILSHVLLETQGGMLKLSGTDLEIGIECVIGAHIEVEGKAAIPSRVLSEYLPTVSSDKISISSAEGVTTLGSEAGETKVNGQAAEEFPLIPEVKASQSFVIPTHELAQSLSAVSFAASRDIARAEISGVYFGKKESTLLVAATDGHRLAERTVSSIEGDFEGSVILPLKTAVEVSRIFGKEEGMVNVELDDSQIRFTLKNNETSNVEIMLVSKVIDGEYPDYVQIIPTDFKAVLKLSKKDLVDSVKGVSVFSGVETNEVVFESVEGGLKIVAESSEVGRSELLVSANITGAMERTSFNYRYVLEGVAVYSSNSVNLSLSGDGGPMLISSEEDTGFRYVVMPLDVD